MMATNETENLLALLVEDDLDLAGTIADVLKIHGISCDHAYNGEAGLEFARQGYFDVIILDLTLPKMDGLTVCETLRREGIDRPVLMLTARDELSDKLAGFEAGTDDYLVKPFAFEELVVRLRALSGRRSAKAKIFEVADLQVDFARNIAKRGDRVLRLSPTAWKILGILSKHSPASVSREQLERGLWGDEPPESNSLNVHLYKLRQQIQRATESEVICRDANGGYSLREKVDGE
ncbi:response regulator transcription factor [Pseudovibrio ascidiaceicola]|uniref:response regulator transcription factor n=1 Tax=Pseudovibrio ascidiaceicola TaxID=285279 RepID=UPI000D68783F|nr:response regulator transcription factor [Pseudovibrio ascidiaceicola]